MEGASCFESRTDAFASYREPPLDRLDAQLQTFTPPIGRRIHVHAAGVHRNMLFGTFLRAGLLVVLTAVSTDALPAATEDGRVPVSHDYVSRSWITDDGLPHNVVTRVQQDRDGYLWLATLAGLTRFDGREFKVFLPPNRSTGGGRNVRDLGLLADGTVLFLPASGGVWQLKKDVLSEHPMSGELRSEALRELYVEPQGAIWVGTSQGIVRWENGRIERFGHEHGINRRMMSFSWATDRSRRTWIGGPDFVGYYRHGRLVTVEHTGGIGYRVAPARSGGVWVWGNGLMKCEDETLVPVADTPWPAGQASVRWMFEDQSGMLWVATSRAGAFNFDGRRFQSLPDLGRSVEHITADREGSIWIATDGGGIHRLRTKVFSRVEAQVSSVCEDSSGAIWFAGGLAGAVRWDGEAQKAFPFRAGGVPLHVTAVCADPGNRLWLATPFGLFQTSVSDPGGTRRIDAGLRNIRVMSCAQNGDVWIAGGGSLGWYRGDTFTPVAGGPGADNAITALAEYPAGHLWFGTVRGDLFEFYSGRLTRSTSAPGLSNTTIHAVLPEPSGNLWLATSEGLVLVANGRVRQFTQADGLPDDLVLQLLADDTGHLWLGTSRGLFRVSRAELLARANDGGSTVNAIAYGPEQGLSGISPTINYQPSAWKDRRGTLWFCTYRGGVGIHPERLPRNAPPPPLFIDEVRLDDGIVRTHELLRVPPGAHQLAFRFAALSFAAPEHVRLRHRLDGFDTAWVDTAPDRSARYAKLPPGDYQLRVTARSSEGLWNRHEATLAVTVLPAWWQTAWFRVGAVLVFAGLVGWGGRVWSQRKLRAQLERLEREHALEKERTRISRDMHDELGGSVTGINLLVQRLRDQSAGKTNSVVDLLQRRVRRLTLELERVVWTVSPKNSSLDQLATFVEQFAQNLFANSATRCRVHGRESIPARPLNPECQHHVLAVAKEAINNVLKHSCATEAVITMSFADEAFALSVRDNGNGFMPEAQEHSERNGLRNMRARVAEMSGTFDIRSAVGTGTEVALRLPIVWAAKT